MRGRVEVEMDAYDDGVHWLVWCDHCICWHGHGRGPGDRGAHCHFEDSPYRANGYVLRYAGRFTKEIEQAHAAEVKEAQRVYRRWVSKGGRGTWGHVWAEHLAAE
ncbi:MAG TPA: hypothetical protein VF178_08415 [Gemmatimonadaceae bacterium]